MILTLCHTWHSNLQYSNPESMGKVATSGDDLLDNLLDVFLSPCSGTLRTKAFTLLYFILLSIGGWKYSCGNTSLLSRCETIAL